MESSRQRPDAPVICPSAAWSANDEHHLTICPSVARELIKRRTSLARQGVSMVNTLGLARSPVRRHLTGPPMTVGQMRVTPTAQITGWQWGAAGAAGLWLKVEPSTVSIDTADGRQTTLSLARPPGVPVWPLLLSVLTGCGCWFIVRSMRMHQKARMK